MNNCETDNNFYSRVYKLVKLIPMGRVTTYGEIAKALGRPNASRVVGYALHKNPSFRVIPCHRVVNRYGDLATSFAFGGCKGQKQLLCDEGVAVEGNRVDLQKYMFYF